ncbi:MAG: hypothetical protein IT436_00665 [Phycisphaerales bacterium]|nr:hypothetical protein [Phycisphaerales bacterium]
MAKMFYSLEEAAGKLGVSPEQVKEMADKGQLSIFRDRDEKIMFKAAQVDLLAGGAEEEDAIPLAPDSDLEPLSLASSGSATGISLAAENPKEQTGISIFEESDQTEEADPSAQTQITSAGSGIIGLADPGASGSRSGSGSAGLLDAAKEADDTSLGADLLDDVYGNETVAQTSEEPAVSSGDSGVGGALFETPATSEPAEAAAVVPMMVAAEAYDGAGSGLVGGLALGAVLSLAVATFAALMGLSGGGGGLLDTLGDKMIIIVGGLAGLTLISGVVGWVIGKKS